MCYNSYMKICNAKKYFFLNLLSILGYFSLCILLCWVFYFYPEIKRLDDTFIDGGMEYSIRIGVYTIYYYLIQTIILFFLCILTFIEFLMKKKNFKFPKPIFEKFPPLFWLGIFFVFIPFYVLIIYYFIAPLVSLVVNNL